VSTFAPGASLDTPTVVEFQSGRHQSLGMDSVTQALLGAAVGNATLGRRVGSKAAVWGAVLGTFPDLDVVYPYTDAVSAFTWHRGPSHSIFVLAALTPLVVWLILKLHPATADDRRGWYALVFLVFGTHVLLDCFTVYGTQALWPLPVPPVGWATVFIIDPLYTVPLAAGVFFALFLRGYPMRARAWNLAGLTLSSVYLIWSIAAKLHAVHEVRQALARDDVAYERLHVQPTPFNTLLWRVVGLTSEGFFEGFWSLASPERGLTLVHHNSRLDLLGQLEGIPAVERLEWFTQGYFRVGVEDGVVVISDLRLGLEPDYPFSFRVAELRNPHPAPLLPERLQVTRDLRRLWEIWERI